MIIISSFKGILFFEKSFVLFKKYCYIYFLIFDKKCVKAHLKNFIKQLIISFENIFPANCYSFLFFSLLQVKIKNNLLNVRYISEYYYSLFIPEKKVLNYDKKNVV